MPAPEPLDITAMLDAWNKGDEKALADIVSLVYKDLRLMARRHLRGREQVFGGSGSLAHEAYLRLMQARGLRCNNRAHFLAVCSQIIRRIVVDLARKRASLKRGGAVQFPLTEALLGSKASGVPLDALDESLDALGKMDARKAKVVELRFFGGLTVQETAEVLQVSEETVTRDWRMAKTWLHRSLEQNCPPV